MKTKMCYFKIGNHDQVGKIIKENDNSAIVRYMAINGHNKGVYRKVKLGKGKYRRVMM